MASFYDTVHDSDLKRVEELLKKGGIGYTVRSIGAATAMKEFQVAEEDLAEAERVLYNSARGNN